MGAVRWMFCRIAVIGCLVASDLLLCSNLYHPTSRSMWASVWEEGHVAVGPLVYSLSVNKFKGLPGLGVLRSAYVRRGN